MTIETIVTEATGIRHRLTLTPTRLEVKIVPGTSKEDCDKIKVFVSLVKERMPPIMQSWRGKIVQRDIGGVTMLTTSLQTNSLQNCLHFYEPIDTLIKEAAC